MKKTKKKAAPKKRSKKESPDSIFRSHARKLGIPEDGSEFSEEEMRVVWTGLGEKCAEVVSSIDKKTQENGFSKVDLPETSETVGDDPVVEELVKMELIPPRRREVILRKSSGGWAATVMVEHNLGESSQDDTAAVVFFIEEDEGEEQ